MIILDNSADETLGQRFWNARDVTLIGKECAKGIHLNHVYICHNFEFRTLRSSLRENYRFFQGFSVKNRCTLLVIFTSRRRERRSYSSSNLADETFSACLCEKVGKFRGQNWLNRLQMVQFEYPRVQLSFSRSPKSNYFPKLIMPIISRARARTQSMRARRLSLPGWRGAGGESSRLSYSSTKRRARASIQFQLSSSDVNNITNKRKPFVKSNHLLD